MIALVELTILKKHYNVECVDHFVFSLLSRNYFPFFILQYLFSLHFTPTHTLYYEGNFLTSQPHCPLVYTIFVDIKRDEYFLREWFPSKLFRFVVFSSSTTPAPPPPALSLTQKFFHAAKMIALLLHCVLQYDYIFTNFFLFIPPPPIPPSHPCTSVFSMFLLYFFILFSKFSWKSRINFSHRCKLFSFSPSSVELSIISALCVLTHFSTVLLVVLHAPTAKYSCWKNEFFCYSPVVYANIDVKFPSFFFFGFTFFIFF